MEELLPVPSKIQLYKACFFKGSLPGHSSGVLVTAAGVEGPLVTAAAVKGPLVTDAGVEGASAPSDQDSGDVGGWQSSFHSEIREEGQFQIQGTAIMFQFQIRGTAIMFQFQIQGTATL